MRWMYGLLLIYVVFSACTARPVEPTRSSRHAIDTLFQQKVTELSPEMDSLCKVMFDDIYQEAVDSIMTARQMEMNMLVE